MPIAPKIEYAKLDDLYLDPTNPRLGRRVASSKTQQGKVLEYMKDWTLDELATSFIENGYWPQEAVIVVREKIYGKVNLVVVEGNRRIAALKYLQLAASGSPASPKWKDLASGITKHVKAIFAGVPYIEVANRAEVSAYLGFRHVTGIKEWKPAEKAQYIAKLIEEEGLTYEEVRKKIGSKTNVVRQHYISYRVLLQMEERDDIDLDAVEDKFSVLYLSLRSNGAQRYLQVDMSADPQDAERPVPAEHLDALANYARWLFGDEKTAPLFSDSRQVDVFGKMLESEDAVQYLERTKNPRFELAFRKAGLGEDSLVEYVSSASDNIQLALQEAHLHRKSVKLETAVKQLSADALQLISIFPGVKKILIQELEDNAGTA